MSTPTLSPGISVTAKKDRIAVQANGYRAPEKSRRAMKMTRVRWSVVVPVLVIAGWLALYVIFIGIGFL